MNKKINILVISHSPYVNGAEIMLKKLVSGIDKSQYNPIVVFPHRGPLSEYFDSNGIQHRVFPAERWIRFTYDIPIKKSNLLQRLDLLRNFIVKNSIDLVYTNTSVIFEGALAAALEKKTHIWHIHEYLFEHPELKSIFPIDYTLKAILKLSDRVVCASDYVKSQFPELKDGPLQNVLSTIYNGINDHKINVSVLSEAKTHRENQNISIVCVGLLSKTKDYETFLKTAKYCINRNSQLTFSWIGGGELKDIEHFAKFVKENQLDGKVNYLGHRNNTRDLLFESDILICTSLMETFSLSILEAMSVSKPVVSTNCGGPSEIIEDGLTGFLVPKRDYEALSKIVLRLSSDKGLRGEIGRKGYDLYKRKFTENTYVENVSVLIDSALKKTSLDFKEDRKKFALHLAGKYENERSAFWKDAMKTSLFKKVATRIRKLYE